MFRWAAGLSGFPPRQRVPGIADASLTAEVPPAKAARGRRHGLLAQASGECIALHSAGFADWGISNQHHNLLPPSVRRGITPGLDAAQVAPCDRPRTTGYPVFQLA